MSYQLHNAIKVGTGIAEILLPHCEPNRFFFAGSVRREHQYVKDIELVCTPKRELKVDPELLFDEGVQAVSNDFIHGLAIFTDQTIKGNPKGRQMQIKVRSKVCPGICLDLFMPAPDDFFRQLAIRTGSKDFVSNVIASAWVRKGWVGAGEHGLRRREDCEHVMSGESKKWKLINAGGEKPPAWRSEEEFFEWLGLKWVAPVYREQTKILNEAQ